MSEHNVRTKLTLGIPLAYLMTYYETKLLQPVTSSEFGLVFTMPLPFASQSTIWHVYHAIQVPTPDPDTSKASVRDIKIEYIGITYNEHEAALLSQHD